MNEKTEERHLILPAEFEGALLLALYIGSAYVGLSFHAVHQFAAPIWAPSGIALAGILLLGYRASPWIAAGALMVNLSLGAPLLAALAIAGGNTLEAVLGVWLIRHLTKPKDLFRRVRGTTLFIVVTILTTIASAVVGVTALSFAGQIPQDEFAITWIAWWAGDALGMLIVAPFLISWLTPYRYPVRSLRNHTLEAILLGVGVFAANALTFARSDSIPENIPLLYLVALPLAWSALRFGPRGVTSVMFLNLLIAGGATAIDKGPFTDPDFFEGMLYLQIYLAATSGTFLVFASIVKEHIRAADLLETHAGKLTDALQKIQGEDQAKTDFLATLAHELRNPMAPLRSSLDIISIQGLASPESEKAVVTMETQVKVMTRLLDDLLDISRIARGKMQIAKERMDLRLVVTHAIETVDAFMKTKRHRVTVSLPEKPLILDADPVRIAQVIVNLLMNAARYTDAGGAISIIARELRERAVITIKDTGIGIEEAMLTKIFEPFLQAARSGDRKSPGLGIGLSLTKQIVELHGGTIEARSEGPGTGSEFVVTLPLSHQTR